MSKTPLDMFAKFVRFVQDNLDLNDTIAIDNLDKDDKYKIVLNKRNLYYYCIELAGDSNTEIFLGEVEIEQIFDNFKNEDDAKVINVMLKKGEFQRNLIFSKNKKLLEYMAKKLSASFVEDLKAITYLYDMFLDNNYYVKNKKQFSNFSLEKINLNNLSGSFNSFVKDAIAKQFKDTACYQGYTIKNKIGNAEISKFFKLDFEGTLFNTFDFSKDKLSHLIETRKKESFFDGNSKPFKDILQMVNSGNVNCALFNSTLFIKKPNIATILEIGECFAVEYAEKHNTVNTYIKNTPLLVRDTYHDAIANEEFCIGMIGTCHKKSLEKYEADFYAKDLHGAFFNYNFSYTTDDSGNKSSDFTTIGIKGTGKTTFVSAMIAQLLNFNPTNNEEKANRLNSFSEGLKKNKIRYFDIKKSGYTVMKLLEKKDPEAVVFIETSLNKFRFNLMNIKHEIDSDGIVHLDRDELALNVLLTSIIIESKEKNAAGTDGPSKAGLNAFESSILTKSIAEIYEKKVYMDRQIRAFKSENIVGYNKLMKLGYSPNQNINEVTESGFDYLRVPTLKTLIKYVTGISADRGNTTIQNHAGALLAKLILIDSMNIFSGYDQLDYKDVNILHIDFDPVKDLPEYIPIFLSLFLKIYRSDKMEQEKIAIDKGRDERPYISFIFEEAKNVTEQPSFLEFFLKVSNEARSYRIKQGFISQLVSHIPKAIFKQISNKFFLLPAKNQKEHLITDIDEAINIDDRTKKLLRDTPEFGVVLINEHGSSSFALDMTEEEIKIFGQSQ